MKTPFASHALLKMGVALLVVAALSGCATRPGVETLVPVTGRAALVDDVTILSVTDRAPVRSTMLAYGAGRGRSSYEEFRLQPATILGTRSPERIGESGQTTSFVTVGRRSMDEKAFLQTVDTMARKQGGKVVVFVHGYNNSYQEAVFRLAQLSASGEADFIPILFSWPSQAELGGYVSDRDAATYARDDLVQLLTSLSKGRPAGSIALGGHSMGAWLVMEALRQLRLQRRDDVIASLNVGLAAPDIDMDVFKAQASVVGRLSPPLTILVSPDDRALAASSRLAGGRPRLGALRLDDPNVQDLTYQGGMRIVDISTMPASSGMNHDRFIAFAARAFNARDGGELAGTQKSGVYSLDAAGRALAAPFVGMSRTIADAQ